MLPQIKDKDSYCHTDKHYNSASNISGDTGGESRSLCSEDGNPQEGPQGIAGTNLVKFHSIDGLDNTNGDKSFALARKKTPHPKELRDMAKKLFDTKLDKPLDIAEDELNAFLLKPSDYAPGTKMSYSGLKNVTDRANLIAYLKTIKD